MTDWLPEVGLNPTLREFYCPDGGHAFYVAEHVEGLP